MKNTNTLTARERKAQEANKRNAVKTVREITQKSAFDNCVNVQAVKTAKARIEHGAQSDEYGRETQRLATIIAHARLNKLRREEHTYRAEFGMFKGDITRASKWETYINTLDSLYTLKRNNNGDWEEICTDKKRAREIEAELASMAGGEGQDLAEEALLSLYESIDKLERKGEPITEQSFLQVFYTYIPHLKLYSNGDIKPKELWRVTATNAVSEAGKAVSRYINKNRSIREQTELYSALEVTIENDDGTNEVITQYKKANPLSAELITDINGKAFTSVSSDNFNKTYEEICEKCNFNKTERFTLFWRYIGGRYSETIKYKDGTKVTTYKYGTKSIEQIADILHISIEAVEKADRQLKDKIRYSGIIKGAENTANKEAYTAQKIACYYANEIDECVTDFTNIQPFMVFDSIGKASTILAIDKSNISKVIKGKLKQTRGYIFKAID